MKYTAFAFALAGLVLAGYAAPSHAGERKAVGYKAGYQTTDGRYARRHAGRSRVYRRVGFYSYSYRDVINTYGMSRARYGSINSYRDPFVDRQTVNGPFDHGFFFDSGMAPRGGDSPYVR